MLSFKERNQAQVRLKFKLSDKAKALLKQPVVAPGEAQKTIVTSVATGLWQQPAFHEETMVALHAEASTLSRRGESANDKPKQFQGPGLGRFGITKRRVVRNLGSGIGYLATRRRADCIRWIALIAFAQVYLLQLASALLSQQGMVRVSVHRICTKDVG